jgi:hypothetical protein
MSASEPSAVATIATETPTPLVSPPAAAGDYIPRSFKQIHPEVFGAILQDITCGMGTWSAIQSRGISGRQFYGSIDADPRKAEQYAEARTRGYDRMAEDALRIADDQSLDPNSRRIMVDVRKWLLSKLCAGRYGDRLELAGSRDAPLTVVISQQDDKLL